MLTEAVLYPPSPAGVPEALTRPTGAYRRHAWLAVLALALFLALYAALTAWFGLTAYRLFGSAHGKRAWVAIVAGVACSFLALFMLKAVFFVRRGKVEGAVELDLTHHPALAAFLDKLAAEARAPRPRRVFLTPDVNAAVFYDLSLLNLIVPAKKNLLIGLGLVNVLSLSELKAVLAHEFGHFAQRSMKVGRWVYMTHQIAAHLVARRDAFDSLLRTLSATDIRIAWVGWILRGIVWSIRALVDTLFSGVVIVERALSREMEFQADRVAVSLTGSDALVHALARTTAADEELSRAMQFAASEHSAGRPVADLFTLQSWLIERKRHILDDPLYGAVPALPADPSSAALHRVFEARLAHPSRMWATHPPSEAREANAKEMYIPAALDDRPAWVLFHQPGRVRADLTAAFLRQLDASESTASRPPANATAATVPPVPIEISLTALSRLYEKRAYDTRYRGLYLDRPITRHVATPDELAAPLADGTDLTQALAELYPASLSETIERADELAEELTLLEAIEHRQLEAAGGVVRFRGEARKRREVPALIAQVKAELAREHDRLHAHDRDNRSVHLAIARALAASAPDGEGSSCEPFLRGLLGVLHYAEHAHANLVDAAGAFENVLAIVTADRKVSHDEVVRLVNEGNRLHAVLEAIHTEAGEVRLGPILAERFELPDRVVQAGGGAIATRWRDYVGPFTWAAPTLETIGPWIGSMSSWVNGTRYQLHALVDAARELLLETESNVAAHLRGEHGTPLPAAGDAPRTPEHYAVLRPGHERPRQLRLDAWDRFMVADGAGATVLRFAVAAGIVGGMLYLGQTLGRR